MRSRIDKIDPATGDVVATIPRLAKAGTPGSPGRGQPWWNYRDRKIHQIDPRYRAIKRTIDPIAS